MCCRAVVVLSRFRMLYVDARVAYSTCLDSSYYHFSYSLPCCLMYAGPCHPPGRHHPELLLPQPLRPARLQRPRGCVTMLLANVFADDNDRRLGRVCVLTNRFYSTRRLLCLSVCLSVCSAGYKRMWGPWLTHVTALPAGSTVDQLIAATSECRQPTTCDYLGYLFRVTYKVQVCLL